MHGNHTEDRPEHTEELIEEYKEQRNGLEPSRVILILRRPAFD